MNIEEKITYIRSILPDHYHVKESYRKGSIHCTSKIGIKNKIDSEDEEHWDYIVKAIKNKFKDDFMEIDHNTNYCHVDFIIYFNDTDK